MNGENPRLIARIEDATLAFGERVILKNCNLNIVDGAITCIIGLSGAGKSTILRLLDGLLLPSEGHVYVRGQDVCHMSEEQLIQVRQKISLSFQFSALLDSLTVGENVALPLRERTHLSEAEIRRTVMDSLESVGLTQAYDNLPAELSGGILKRAGRARDRYSARPGAVRRADDRARPNRNELDHRHDPETARKTQWQRGRDLARLAVDLCNGRLRRNAFRRCDHRLRHGRSDP